MKCIVKKLDDGLPIKHAINLCGLPKRTFYNWIDFGKEGLSEILLNRQEILSFLSSYSSIRMWSGLRVKL